MGKYMKMLDLFYKMEEVKRRNNYNKRGVPLDQTHRAAKARQEIEEDPMDLLIGFEPELKNILVMNYDKIGKTLLWLQKKIKEKMPK